MHMLRLVNRVNELVLTGDLEKDHRKAPFVIWYEQNDKGTSVSSLISFQSGQCRLIPLKMQLVDLILPLPWLLWYFPVL